MKVIKQGHNEDRMQVTCIVCEAIFEITSADLGHKETETIEGIYFYNCPCCGAKRYLDVFEMTRGMKESVIEKLCEVKR